MFKEAKTETLLITRDHLLDGLDKVATSITCGKFNTVGDKGKAPPSQSGQMTLALLVAVNNELVERGLPTVFNESEAK